MYVTSVYSPDGTITLAATDEPPRENGLPVSLEPEQMAEGLVISKIASNFGATIFDGPFAEAKQEAKKILETMLRSPYTCCSTDSTDPVLTPVFAEPTSTEASDELLTTAVDCLATIVETLTKRGYDADAALECALMITKNG